MYIVVWKRKPALLLVEIMEHFESLINYIDNNPILSNVWAVELIRGPKSLFDILPPGEHRQLNKLCYSNGLVYKCSNNIMHFLFTSNYSMNRTGVQGLYEYKIEGAPGQTFIPLVLTRDQSKEFFKLIHPYPNIDPTWMIKIIKTNQC